MVYAQIKDGIVVNTIELNDASLESIFSAGFDNLVRVDELPISEQPSIGWGYIDGEFIAP